jgi:flavin-dependent dehydrogenase
MSGRSNITIAGAGPAGLAAAIILSKAGHRVRVIEQRSGVGRRFNDDFQGLENWSRNEDVLDEIKAMGIEINWWSRPFYGGVLYDPSLRPIAIKSSRPLFYMLRRGYSHRDSLDLSLYDQARGAGVEFLWNQRAILESTDIVATGPIGPPVAVARGITFKTDHEDLACAILSDHLAPAGYLYFLVADGHATLATVLFGDFKSAEDCLHRSINAVQRLFSIPEPVNPKRWGGYGQFLIPRSCERDGALWIGEAAGFQDLLFGFGIRSALVSAGLAARSIISGKSYDELWQERLLPHLRASVVSRGVYKAFGDHAKRGLWYLTGKNPNPDRFMRWLYSFSIAHRILYPLSRMRYSSLRTARAPEPES